MSDNKPLRERVAEAISKVASNSLLRPHPKRCLELEAADAAIQVVLDGMRCVTCKLYRRGRCDLGIFGIEDGFGCIRWEQKQ